MKLICAYCLGQGYKQPAYLDGEYEDCSHCNVTGYENGDKE